MTNATLHFDAHCILHHPVELVCKHYHLQMDTKFNGGQ